MYIYIYIKICFLVFDYLQMEIRLCYKNDSSSLEAFTPV
jgi:hypothetical protein